MKKTGILLCLACLLSGPAVVSAEESESLKAKTDLMPSAQEILITGSQRANEMPSPKAVEIRTQAQEFETARLAAMQWSSVDERDTALQLVVDKACAIGALDAAFRAANAMWRTDHENAACRQIIDKACCLHELAFALKVVSDLSDFDDKDAALGSIVDSACASGAIDTAFQAANKMWRTDQKDAALQRIAAWTSFKKRH